MKTKPVIIDGKPYDGPKLARKLGIVPWPVVRMRLNRGWEPYDAFHIAVRISGGPILADADKAVWHDSERIRHEAAAQHHRQLRDAALRRIDAAKGKEVAQIERELLAQDGVI